MKRPKPSTARPPMGPLVATPLTLEMSEAPGQWRLYPIGDRATRHDKTTPFPGQSVTGTPSSVTHVLNLKCYLCFDRANRLGIPHFEFCNLH